MWPVLVVVPDVLGERLFQVTTPEDEDPVQALSPYGPNEAPRMPSERGDLTGVLMTSIASAANTASKLELKLRVKIADEKAKRPTLSARSPAKVLATWVTKALLG